MTRPSRLTPQDIKTIRELYASGRSRAFIARFLLDTRGITINPVTLYYHLGHKAKVKPIIKNYEYYLREDCAKRGAKYVKPPKVSW